MKKLIKNHSFALVTVFIMVSVMSLFGQVLHGHFDLVSYLIQWPVMFIAAFSLQMFVAMPAAKRVTGKTGTSERTK